MKEKLESGKEEKDFCEWTYDKNVECIDFSCGEYLYLNVSPNAARLNMFAVNGVSGHVKFCPYCGKPYM